MTLLELDTNKEYYFNIIRNIWHEAGDSFPEFLIEVPSDKKAQNELYIKAMSDEFQKHMKRFSRLPFGRKKWLNKTVSMINDVLHKESIIGLHKTTDLPSIDAFHEELKDFLRQVRLFAPELTFEEIGQAIRNYIVYRMFKEIHQVKNGFSMAGFGYSMLYPFTDNYIDSKKVTVKEKSEYNQLIRNKLEGKPVQPKISYHRKTCDLLQAIESEYPRNKDNSIFTLLLMMLDAQENSIRQQNRALPLTPEERLDISVYKGGISVLVDRYLVNKDLTKEDMIFYLGLGLFLQLADDLQDIESDSEQGYQTLFTVDLDSLQEEKLVNKVLHFIHKVMSSYQAENEGFKNFLLSNCYQLIFTSLVGSKMFFSTDYLERIEHYLPVSYPFVEEFKKGMLENKDIKVQTKYMKILDDIIFI